MLALRPKCATLAARRDSLNFALAARRHSRTADQRQDFACVATWPAPTAQIPALAQNLSDAVRDKWPVAHTLGRRCPGLRPALPTTPRHFRALPAASLAAPVRRGLAGRIQSAGPEQSPAHRSSERVADRRAAAKIGTARKGLGSQPPHS